ncbi:MAG TPA: metallophosphoesterase [Anaeromyxobacteraceae bacterium]|jgi:hypothetical protein|nr:metallophosphoesterase [Anaeromyxobacteraceae bacterium]
MEQGSGGTGRRKFLKCMAWAGTGLVWTLEGGLLRSRALAEERPPAGRGGFRFVQISDTHVGFKGEVNREPLATLREALARIDALDPQPDFLIHTGDLSHAQKAGAFDDLAQTLGGARVKQVFFVPGEHDVFVDGGVEFLRRFGKGTTGQGWRSFDHRGVHFIGLVNVLSYKAEGLGLIGADQLAWLARDLEPISSSTPVVVYAHVPLWAVYPKWGWVTGDGELALAQLRRFGSVTVLNGHIHQILQKVEGHVSFHTAASTAFPQPAPGTAPAPGPMKVPAERLRSLLGLRTVTYTEGAGALAVVDSPLAG